MQLCMVRDHGLDEDGRFLRIETGSDKIDQKVFSAFLDSCRVRITCSKCMPVRNEIETVVSILKINPVFQRPHEVSKMHLAAGLHAAQYAILHYCSSCITSIACRKGAESSAHRL